MRSIITAALWMAAIVHALAMRAWVGLSASWPHLRVWLFGQVTEQAVDYASLLEAMTVRDLRATCVTLGLPSKAYRAARKTDLVALLADLHVNPTL